MKRLATILLVLLPTTLWLALAVFAEGGVGAFFARPALIAAAVLSGVLAVAGAFSQGSLSRGEREDRANRWVVPAFALIGLADAFLPAWSDRRDFWVFGGDAVRWLGVALYAIGGVLRLAPVFVLGSRFSGLVAIQPDHKLVTGGLYRLIRNPSYLGMIILTLGWGLAFRSGLGVLLAFALAPPLVARIEAEERLLAAEFGGAWADYKGRTWRLIPKLY